jgi:hypothetical protein
MWLKDWIREAAGQLALPESRFRILPDGEAAGVRRAVEARFVKPPCRRFWWECLGPEHASARYVGGASLGYR